MIRPTILALALAAPAAAQTLVAHYEFDETSGVVVSDSSANGVDGRIVGMGASWITGPVGGALDLDGFGVHARVPGHPVQNVSQLTIAAWVRVDFFQEWDGILTKGINSEPYALQISGDGRLKFTANWGSPPGGSGSGSWYSAAHLRVTEWEHVAVTFDGSNLRFFMNGVPAGSHSLPTLVLGTVAEDMTFGADLPGGDEYLDGALDDVRLYDGALSAVSIEALYGSTIGTRYCTPANPNSTGSSARIHAYGSPLIAENNLTLLVSDLPQNQFGLFVVGTTQAFVPNPGGSQGNVCIGGTIGRCDPTHGYPIVNSQAPSGFWMPFDLTNVPSPAGLYVVAPGQSLHFQAWFRDQVGGGATSNFTDGLAITFQ